jgi:hypothetical protein
VLMFGLFGAIMKAVLMAMAYIWGGVR